MTKYSRTSKYEELRNRLQNDTEPDLRTRELSEYEAKLNRISGSKPEAPVSYSAEDHDPLHARHSEYLQEEVKPAAEADTGTLDFGLSNALFSRNENYHTASFNNEYLDEYLKEAKLYNVEKGNAFSTDTDVNILKSLKETPKPKPAPKPYVEPEKPAGNTLSYISSFVSPAQNQKEVPAVKPQEVKPEKPAEPVRPAVQERPVQKPVQQARPAAPKPVQAPPVQEAPAANEQNDATLEDLMFFPRKDENNYYREFINNRTQKEESSEPSTKTMTREDIAAEVQSMRVAQEPVSEPKPAAYADDDPDYRTRQQLLNETAQLRVQMDDYEDNLTAVSDSMQKTNRVLNGVLIVLIVTLSVMLLVVLYWILSSRGIL